MANCGVEEDRTPNLRNANAVLYQLSYHPVNWSLSRDVRPTLKITNLLHRYLCLRG